jgi:protein toll
VNLQGEQITAVNENDLTCQFKDKCPKKCSCQKRPADNMVLVNCSNQGLNEVPQLLNPSVVDNFESIELDISKNNITELPNIETCLGYNHVSNINARHNSITNLDVKNFPEGLVILDLSDNRIQTVEQNVLSRLNSSKLKFIGLSNNLIDCSCSSIDFVSFLQSISSKTDRVTCAEDGKEVKGLSRAEICTDTNQLLLILSIFVGVLGFIVAILSVLYLRYNMEIKVWLFSRNLLLWLITEEDVDKDKAYDAFISYSHKDEEFVTNHLIPTLEKKMQFKTCWHVRDWMPGELILTQAS